MPDGDADAIEIIDGAGAGQLRALHLAPDMGIFWRGRPDLQYEALLRMAELPGAHITAARQDRAIVGFVAMLPPEPTSRWHGIAGIWELEGMEVSRARRGHGVARRMIDALFANPIWEERLVIATVYRWCWDMEYMGLTVQAYQHILERLAVPFGFKPYATNDPDIVRYPGNILAARVGARALPAVYDAFLAQLHRRD